MEQGKIRGTTGKLLALILFLIMIGDIDEQIINCIVSGFADIRNNKKKGRTIKKQCRGS